MTDFMTACLSEIRDLTHVAEGEDIYENLETIKQIAQDIINLHNKSHVKQ